MKIIYTDHDGSYLDKHSHSVEIKFVSEDHELLDGRSILIEGSSESYAAQKANGYIEGVIRQLKKAQDKLQSKFVESA